MKTANKCPRCGAKNFSCESEAGTCDVDMPFFDQSNLCRERVKVAKLKERAESAEWAVKELQKTVSTLRNPKF